jgi:hypothetical protein
MSGRGRGRGYGRGRSSGRGKGRSSNNKPTITKRGLSDYVYYLGSAKTASDYENTTEYLINHIKKTFEFGNDIGTALEELEPFDMNEHMPALSYSTSTDPAAKEADDRQYEMIFKAEYDAYMKRKQAYENNLTKAYAFLWSQCARGMQNKIEARSDYTTVKGNPIELLKAIKQHALNYQEHRYEMSIISDAIKTVVNLKQRENESLQEYTRRFKTARDVLVSHIGGPIELTKYMTTMSDYKANELDSIEKCRKKAFQQLMAFIYLENSDRSKYGSLLTGLQTQQSLGHNQYPVTITEANNVLSSHRFDNSNKKRKDKKDTKTDENENTENEEAPALSFAQLEGKCWCCGKQGHMSSSCRNKDKPKDQWFINKVKQADQSHLSTSTPNSIAQSSDDTASVITTSATSTSQHSNAPSSQGWTGAHVLFCQSEQMKDWILLDNESTTSIFCNPNYVTDIKYGPDQLTLSTNGGGLQTNYTAKVPGYHKDVWFDPKAMTNIFAFHEMEEKYRITYDSHHEPAFYVHTPDKIIKFTRAPNGLYYYKPNLNTGATIPPKPKAVSFVESVKENKKFFTDRQVSRAKQARALYQTLGTPSIKDFKAIIRMNCIKNNPITTEDIDLAEKIFGPDIGSLKGKTTRAKPKPVVDDFIEIPRELIAAQQDITLCIDGLKINGIPFLATISRNIMYRTCEWVKHQTVSVYRSVLDSVFRIYNMAGFRIVAIHCDNEFKPLMDELKDIYNVTLNYASAQEHVPEAERNNRVIKERFRAAFHRLPFTKIPKIMIKVLAMECTKRLNYFPPKGGVSPYYSPRMILHQENLDYAKHCRVPFGTYIQAHQEPSPTNTQHPRTLDCLYMRYLSNKQGGHELLDLRTGRLITRRAITPVPMTQSVIELVHALAERDNMPNGLKITTKTGHILYDSAWIAGVDYEHEDENNEDYDDDYTESEEESDEESEEDEYDEMDPNEIADILQEKEQPSNPSDDEIQEEQEFETEDEEETQENQDDEQTEVRRSTRTIVPPERLTYAQCHLQTQGHEAIEYDTTTAQVFVQTVHHLQMVMSNKKHKHHAFVETFSLKRGLKTFGEKGRAAAFDEMKQLHDREVFYPVDISKLTQHERRRAMESLIFLVEKRDGRIKARACANGSVQRSYVPKEDATSPTAMTESILLTATIEAHEGRDVMTADIPNAFVQTEVDQSKEKIIMKIRGPMVDMLVEMEPTRYAKYVVYEGKEKVLYVQLLKALYGMLQSSLLYYKKFRKDIESIGFKVNPYDPCVANRIINGSQQTVTWHVDDLKSSHKNPKVNDLFLQWLEKKYGNEEIGKVKAVRGKRHDYLAMNLDYSTPGVVKVDMKDYVKNMVEDFPEELEAKGATYPWNENLFKVDKNKKNLDTDQAESFHTFVAKTLFVTKRARPDVQPAVAFLTTRVQGPNEGDWFKLKKMMRFLKRTADDVLTLKADDMTLIKWHLDASFAVHDDFKSHTGATMSLGQGAIQSISTKQKINTRSSTEAELVSDDDIIAKVLWTRRFLESQGYQVKDNIIYRDNQSTMKLEQNGKASSGKRTRHFNIKYFYITDLIDRGELKVKYCPTDEMIADYMTKPLTGNKFTKFRQEIMNLPDTTHKKESVVQQECVERKDTLKKHNPIKRHVANTNPNLYPNLNVHVAHFLNLI